MDPNLTAYDEPLLVRQKEFSEDSFSKKLHTVPRLFDECPQDENIQSNSTTLYQVTNDSKKNTNLNASFATLEESTKFGTKESSYEKNYDLPLASFNSTAKNEIENLKNKILRRKSDLEARKSQNSAEVRSNHIDSCQEIGFTELTNSIKYGSQESEKQGTTSTGNNSSGVNSNEVELKDIKTDNFNSNNKIPATFTNVQAALNSSKDQINGNGLNRKNSGIISVILVLLTILSSWKFWVGDE